MRSIKPPFGGLVLIGDFGFGFGGFGLGAKYTTSLKWVNCSVGSDLFGWGFRMISRFIVGSLLGFDWVTAFLVRLTRGDFDRLRVELVLVLVADDVLIRDRRELDVFLLVIELPPSDWLPVSSKYGFVLGCGILPLIVYIEMLDFCL